MVQTTATTRKPFDPTEHFMKIGSGEKAKDYLPVQWRLVWFREAFPQGTIETEMVHLDLERDTEEEGFAWNTEKRKNERVMKHAKGFVVFHATVKDGLGGIATGTKSEKAASFPDFIEKAETGSIGRALAALGFGTQFTGDELDEAHRIVDAPVQHNGAPEETTGNGQEANVSSTSKIVPMSEIPNLAELKAAFVQAGFNFDAVVKNNFPKIAQSEDYTPDAILRIKQKLDAMIATTRNKKSA